MAMIGFSVKAVQLPSAILNVKELGGKCMTSVTFSTNSDNP